MHVEAHTSTLAARDVDPIRGLCHDMRQPIAAILMLADTADSDPQRRLDLIAEQARWLASLVDDVLVDAAADDVGPVDVTACTALAVEGARPSAACRLVLAAPPGVRATARSVALTRAVSCLVDNAVRAAGPDGAVTVTVADSADADGVTISVVDDGPGLGQVPARSSLGLSISRALVASCGGTLALRPGSDGGAVATIGLLGVPRTAVAS
jgi:signal transduction histidine kinase